MASSLKVEIYAGSNLLREERFDREIIKIGRLASAHLKLDDPKVARIHAVIEASSGGDGYSIIDMGSTDGTFVNGERVSKEKLADGDEVQVGDCKLIVSIEEVAESAPLKSAPPTVPPPSVPPERADTMAEPEPLPVPSEAPSSATPSVPPEPSAPDASNVAMASVPPAAPEPSKPPEDVALEARVPSFPDYRSPPGRLATGTEPLRPGSFDDAPPAEGAIVPPSTLMELSQGQQQWPAGTIQYSAWGTVPNNLASNTVAPSERMLEIKTLWGGSVLDTVNVHDRPVVTMGDEAVTSGAAIFKRFVGCDIDVPARNLPARAYPLAVSTGEGATYSVNIHSSMGGRLERADGTVYEIDEVRRGGEPGELPEVMRVPLEAEETLYLEHGKVILQLRYVRRTRFIPPGIFETMNYSWVNILILAFFFHALMIASFIATPKVQEELTEKLFKNPNRFAQFKFREEEKKSAASNMLDKLKAGPEGAKAKGKEGKAGRKDYKGKKQGRMAVKGDPNDEEIAKSTLNKLFGNVEGGDRRSYLFGTGGLGGELEGALGGVTGAQVGDAAGLGGLGTRGAGPGGGGLSMSSVGLGKLGTRGRGGGGDGDYGAGVGKLGKKADRDIVISAGRPIIMGSLDKEIIRRVIKAHINQIKYCYEKELVRSPGLFGKVNVEFTITAKGSVSQAKTKQSTLNNAEVERCIGAKIRTWKFPKPKGGGIVIVRYPFVFKRTG